MNPAPVDSGAWRRRQGKRDASQGSALSGGPGFEGQFQVASKRYHRTVRIPARWLLQGPRYQVVDAQSRVAAGTAGQYSSQAGARVSGVQVAGLNARCHAGHGVAAPVISGGPCIPAIESHGLDGVFDGGRRDFDPAIGQEDLQPIPVAADMAELITKRGGSESGLAVREVIRSGGANDLRMTFPTHGSKLRITRGGQEKVDLDAPVFRREFFADVYRRFLFSARKGRVRG